MGHLTLELILWLLLAFLIGCILGCLFRKLFGAAPEVAPLPVKAPEPEKVATPTPVAKPVSVAKPTPVPAPVALASTGVAKRPKGLAAARTGKGDELQRISGIGPKLEKTLHSLGFFHFDQIANWTPGEVQWVDEHLRFKGRIEREDWIPQAKLLAAGNESEFSRLHGSNSAKSKSVSKLDAEKKIPNPSTTTGTTSLKSTKANKQTPKVAVATGIASVPKKLTGARGGKADDLQQISGVGPKLEKTLHGLGFYHFDQIAEWTPDEVQWVDENLTFKGRIDREEWMPQCKLLAAGDMDTFVKMYGTGGLKSKKSGKSESGSRTRKS